MKPKTTSRAENESDSRCSSGEAHRTQRCSENALHPSPCGRAGPRLPTKKPLISSTEPTQYQPTESARPTLEPTRTPIRRASTPVPPTSVTKIKAMRRVASRTGSDRLGRRCGCDFGARAAHLFLGHRPALEREMALGDVARRAATVRECRLLDVAASLDEARAARMEAAGARRVDRRRHVAL